MNGKNNRSTNFVAGRTIQANCNKFWGEHKANPEKLREKFEELELSLKRPGPMLKYLTKVPSMTNTKREPFDASSGASASKKTVQSSSSSSSSSSDEGVEDLEYKKATPSQDKIRTKLEKLNAEIDCLEGLKEKAIPLSRDMKISLKNYRKDKAQCSKQLSRLVSHAKAQQKYEDKKRQRLRNLMVSAEPSHENVITRKIGRPRLEEQFPNLLETIVKIVSPGASAESKRRSELLRCCKTLDDLKEKLELDHGNYVNCTKSLA